MISLFLLTTTLVVNYEAWKNQLDFYITQFVPGVQGMYRLSTFNFNQRSFEYTPYFQDAFILLISCLVLKMFIF